MENTRAKMEESYLPEELMTEILVRLPVTSLMRFRSVCKYWYALTKDRNFVCKHFDFSNKQNPERLLVRSINDDTRKPIFSLIDDKTLEKTPSLNPDLPSFYKERVHFGRVATILGPVNGIFCMFDKSNILLWNPATRESKILPPVILPPDFKGHMALSVAFGFDSNVNDHKVLRHTSLLPEDYQEGERFHLRETDLVSDELYTLSTGCWREIYPPNLSAIEFTTYNTYLNGACHGWHNGILSFNIAHETFQVTDIPINNENYDFEIELAVVDDCLGLNVYRYWDPDMCFDIWVMREYGVKESWTKLFTVGSGPTPFLAWDRLLGIAENGKFIIEHEDGQQLVWYDNNGHEVKSLIIDAGPFKSQLVIYRESMISLTGGIKLEQRDDLSDGVSEPHRFRKVGN